MTTVIMAPQGILYLAMADIYDNFLSPFLTSNMAAMGNNCFCYMKNHLHNFLKFHITCVFLNPLIFSFNTNINKTETEISYFKIFIIEREYTE